MSPTTSSPDRWSFGRSTCVTSPVTTIFEPNPSRVRNIFICSGVVFCASSRITNESLSVRPRMKASGATSITPFSRCAETFSGSSMSLQRVEQRAQVRVDLGHQVAGQEAQALAGLHGRAREDDPVDLAARERGDGHRDRQERLAGAGRADAEGDRLAADRVDVALLVDRARRHAQVAVAPDDVLEHRRGRLALVEHARDRLDRRRARCRARARPSPRARARPWRPPGPPRPRRRGSPRCRAGRPARRGAPRAS